MRKSFIVAFSIFPALTCLSQVSLSGIIEKVQDKTVITEIYKNRVEIAEVNYRIFESNYKMTISLNGSLPAYNKDNFAVTQPDGSLKFISRSQSNSNMNFGISQPIVYTGGTISLNTDLTRFDDWERKATRYSGTPVFVKLIQPLFAFNGYKWSKRIEPLRLKEAHSTYKQNIQVLIYQVCSIFFDILEAQTARRLGETNIAYIDKNLSIEKRRVEIGVSTEDKVLQLEINKITQLQQVNESQINTRNAFSILQSFLGTGDTLIPDLILPHNIPMSSFDKIEVLQSAKRNLPMYLFYSRSKLEAISKIIRTRNEGRQVNIALSYGLNNAKDNLPDIYRDLNNQQRYSLSFSLPIVDGGKRRKSVELAKLEQKNNDLSFEAEEVRLISEVTSILEKIPILKTNIKNAGALDSLSQKRYVIANRLFELGKISLLELQNAELAKDNAAKGYVYALRQFWEAYYLLKAKTLID